MKWVTVGGVAIAIIAMILSKGWFPVTDEVIRSPEEEAPEISSSPATGIDSPVRVITRSLFVEEYGAPDRNIRSDLESVFQLLTDCQLVVKNFDTYFLPDNKAITGFLRGTNPDKIAWIPPDHAAINPEGELVDRNGVPLFFHRESGLRFQLRSAGHDQIIWTSDDVVYPFKGGVSLPD